MRRGEKMKVYMLSAMIGLFLGAINVFAAPASPEHPIVKEIVEYMLSNPKNMEEKIADAIDRYNVENGRPSYEQKNKGIAKYLSYHAVSAVPSGLSKRAYFTDTVIAYLRQ